jgi:hypothetical protein
MEHLRRDEIKMNYLSHEIHGEFEIFYVENEEIRIRSENSGSVKCCLIWIYSRILIAVYNCAKILETTKVPNYEKTLRRIAYL